MLFDVNHDIKVARRTRGKPSFAFVAELEPRAVVHSRWNSYRERNWFSDTSLSLAFRTWVRDHHAFAAALAAGGRNREKALLCPDLPGATAIRTATHTIGAPSRSSAIASVTSSQAL